MTMDEREQRARDIVAQFATEFWRDRSWQLGQMLLGAQMALSSSEVRVPHGEQWLEMGMEPQEWLVMARAGLGLITNGSGENRGYVYEICQGLAEWLFAIPGTSAYTIPDGWYDTDMGSLWAAALIWASNDELITLTQAAELTGIPLTTLTSRVDRGRIKAFIDPTSKSRQGRRLVRKSDILAQGEGNV